MNTLLEVNQLVQSIVTTHVPLRLQQRIKGGIQAFSLQALDSINANGRSLAANRKTGESRVYRVLSDKRTIPLLSRILKSLLSSGAILYCSLDHSQFGPFCVAVLSISLRKGRSIPLWCQVNRSKGALIKPLFKALKKLARELSPQQQLVLVMDRWFCGKKLFALIEEQGWKFICRAKYDRRVWVPWEERYSISIGEISHEETVCWYHGRKLRMIRSHLRPKMKQKEPWFLLTNLTPTEASRIQVLHRYEERFEIEEVFKDIKWLQRLEWQQVKKPRTMQALLLFTFLGWWLLWALYRRNKTLDRTRRSSHPKHRLSWFRTIWELLHQLFFPPELRLVPLSP